MSVAALKRWHWLVIAVIVGLGLAYTNRITPADFPAYGDLLKRQTAFEASLVQTIGADPRFKDLVVQRCRVPKLGEVDFVYGRYCTGQVEKDGAYHYRPKYFVARCRTGQPARSIRSLRATSAAFASFSPRSMFLTRTPGGARTRSPPG
jgi:hypothetical protein